MVFFESDTDQLILLWRFIAGIGLCFGIIVFFLLRFPQYRRKQFSHGPGCGTFISLIVGFSIAASFAGIAWQLIGNSFVEAQLNSSQIELRYILPERSKTIYISDISRINLQFMEKRKYRVIMHTDQGVFQSRPKSIHLLRSEFQTFKQQVRAHGGSFSED